MGSDGDAGSSSDGDTKSQGTCSIDAVDQFFGRRGSSPAPGSPGRSAVPPPPPPSRVPAVGFDETADVRLDSGDSPTDRPPGRRQRRKQRSALEATPGAPTPLESSLLPVAPPPVPPCARHISLLHHLEYSLAFNLLLVVGFVIAALVPHAVVYTTSADALSDPLQDDAPGNSTPLFAAIPNSSTPPPPGVAAIPLQLVATYCGAFFCYGGPSLSVTATASPSLGLPTAASVLFLCGGGCAVCGVLLCAVNLAVLLHSAAEALRDSDEEGGAGGTARGASERKYAAGICEARFPSELAPDCGASSPGPPGMGLGLDTPPRHGEQGGAEQGLPLHLSDGTDAQVPAALQGAFGDDGVPIDMQGAEALEGLEGLEGMEGAEGGPGCEIQPRTWFSRVFLGQTGLLEAPQPGASEKFRKKKSRLSWLPCFRQRHDPVLSGLRTPSLLDKVCERLREVFPTGLTTRYLCICLGLGLTSLGCALGAELVASDTADAAGGVVQLPFSNAATPWLLLHAMPVFVVAAVLCLRGLRAGLAHRNRDELEAAGLDGLCCLKGGRIGGPGTGLHRCGSRSMRSMSRSGMRSGSFTVFSLDKPSRVSNAPRSVFHINDDECGCCCCGSAVLGRSPNRANTATQPFSVFNGQVYGGHPLREEEEHTVGVEEPEDDGIPSDERFELNCHVTQTLNHHELIANQYGYDMDEPGKDSALGDSREDANFIRNPSPGTFGFYPDGSPRSQRQPSPLQEPETGTTSIAEGTLSRTSSMASSSSSALSQQTQLVNALSAASLRSRGRPARPVLRRNRLNAKKRDRSGEKESQESRTPDSSSFPPLPVVPTTNGVPGEEVVSEGSSSWDGEQDRLDPLASPASSHAESVPARQAQMASFSLSSDASSRRSSLAGITGSLASMSAPRGKQVVKVSGIDGNQRADSLSSVSSLQVMQREIDAEEQRARRHPIVRVMSPLNAPQHPPAPPPDAGLMSTCKQRTSLMDVPPSGLTNVTATDPTAKMPAPSELGGTMSNAMTLSTEVTAKMPPADDAGVLLTEASPIIPSSESSADRVARRRPSSTHSQGSNLTKNESIFTDRTAKMPPASELAARTRRLPSPARREDDRPDERAPARSSTGFSYRSPARDSSSDSTLSARPMPPLKLAALLLDGTFTAGSRSVGFPSQLNATYVNQYQILRAMGASPVTPTSGRSDTWRQYVARDVTGDQRAHKGPQHSIAPSAQGAGIVTLQMRRSSGCHAWLAERKGEIAILKRLRHRNLVRTLEVLSGDDDGGLGDVHAIVSASASEASIGTVDPMTGDLLTPALPEKLLAHYLLGVVSGLSYLHTCGIAHGDLRPENIVIVPDTLRAVAKISNLGTATVLRSPSTPASVSPYAAPEMLVDGEVHGVSPAGDVWALGVTLFTLRVGQHPFIPRITAKVPLGEVVLQGVHLPRDVGTDLADLMMGMLHADPGRRWTATDVRDQVFFDPVRGGLGSTGRDSTTCDDPLRVDDAEVDRAVTKLVLTAML